MELGELRDINLREVWPHEANDFTPWLAENLSRLSQAIGIPLELEDQEVAVEDFSADILATHPADGSRVLIENQLERTDHRHLGQIMTYLAGLDAKTVVWVAQEFREPHLSAIRWLNTHTSQEFAFFAVKVRVVQIGDATSPAAPLFDVVERPNEWIRQLQAANDDNSNIRLSSLREFRKDFWQQYAQRYPDDIELRPNHKSSNVYHTIAGAIVSQWIGQEYVGIYMHAAAKRYSEELRQQINRHVASLQREYGIEPGSNNHCGLSLKIDTTDRANWPQMSAWLHEKLGEFRRIIKESAATKNDDFELEPPKANPP